MAASTSITTSETGVLLSRRMIMGIAGLIGVIVVTGTLLIFNYYWLGLVCLFAGLFLVVAFTLEKYQRRNPALLLIAFLFVMIVAGTLTNDYWLANPEINPFPGDNLAAFLASVVVGVGAGLITVIIPFLWLVGIATAGILKWHENSEGISFLDAYKHLLLDLLGTFRMAVTVEEGEIKGEEQSKKLFETFGGPGWLTVYPGQVVVLHKRGKTTRAVSLGTTVLEGGERIKAILPFGSKGGPNIIENVLTRDQIPLKITVSQSAQLEPRADTLKRLQEAVREAEGRLQNAGDKKEAQKLLDEAREQLRVIEGDNILKDEYDQCYERVAKLAATRAAKIGEAMKGGVENNIRDIVMTCNFDELFTITAGGDGGLTSNIQQRRIQEMERFVADRVSGSGPGRGIILKNVDITEIKAPEQVEEKLIAEAAALAERRMKFAEAQTEERTARIRAMVTQIEADAKRTVTVIKAEAEQIAGEYEAKAILERARANAQAEVIKGRGKAEAKAEYYRHVLEVLQTHGQSPDTVHTVLKSLSVSEDEIRRFLQLFDLREYRRGRGAIQSVPDQDESIMS